MKKLFTLIAVAVMAFAANANELTVCDNAENAYGYLPVFGYWYDAEGMSQMIYPAEMLTDMAGGQITELKFYTAAAWGDGWEEYTIAFSGGEIELALKEVEETAFGDEGDVTIAGATVVATTVPETGGMYLTFVLDEPFQYNGGNLLVQTTVTTPGSYGRTYFLGEEFDYNCAYYAYDYYGEWTETVVNKLSTITFSYEAGVTPPPTPTEKTGAPVFNGYTTDGIHAYFVEIVPSEPSTIWYRVRYPDGTYSEWAVYEDILSFTEDGMYRVEAYAIADGKLESDPIAYEFVVSPATGLSELMNGKTVANVRYFNMAGQEMQEANGVTIVVTTYTDGTTNSVKVMK